MQIINVLQARRDQESVQIQYEAAIQSGIRPTKFRSKEDGRKSRWTGSNGRTLLRR